jgi:hypothetical protein
LRQIAASCQPESEYEYESKSNPNPNPYPNTTPLRGVRDARQAAFARVVTGFAGVRERKNGSKRKRLDRLRGTDKASGEPFRPSRYIPSPCAVVRVAFAFLCIKIIF